MAGGVRSRQTVLVGLTALLSAAAGALFFHFSIRILLVQ